MDKVDLQKNKDKKKSSKLFNFNKKIIKFKRGFTLVELLAAITILGILTTISIIGISSVIKRGQKQYYISQEDNMVVAARSYAEKNPQYLPKVSGQTLKVPLKDLVKNKYIDKVVNYQKHNCDENASYVQIFKYQDDYYYVPYLSCEPYYSDPLASNSSFKNFDISFTDKMVSAKASIKMQDDNYGIVSYNYVIYSNNKIVYQSEYFDSFKTESIIGRDIDLTSYVPSKIKVTITAVNGLGVSKSYSKSHDYSGGGNKNDTSSQYIACGEATNSSIDWSSSEKVVSVKCVSTNSSVGCARDSFSKKYTSDIGKDQIVIYDKNGNFKKCDVNVFIDRTAPTLTIKVYKLNSSGNKDGDPIAQGSAKHGDTNKTINVTKNASNGWLNKSNYPNGLIIEGSYSDTSPIHNLTISENASGATSESDSKYNTLTNNTSDPNKSSGTFSLKMTGDGYRYAKLAVTDSVSLTSSVIVKFKMDRVAPTCKINKENKNWTNGDVSTSVSCNDTGTSGCVKDNYDNTYKDENTIEKDSVQISDNAGNTNTCEYYVKHDKEAPACGENDGTDKWTKDDRTVSVDCSETNGSGCTKAKFSNKYTSTKETDNITISDNAGNYRVCPVNVFVDKIGPSYKGCELSKHNYSGRVTIGSKWKDDESGLSSDNSRLEYCYKKLCSGGTNSCSTKKNNYTLDKSDIKLASEKDWYWSLGGHMHWDGNLYYSVINSGCAKLSGQNVRTYWYVCDNVGNCTNSGKKTFDYNDDSCS